MAFPLDPNNPNDPNNPQFPPYDPNWLAKMYAARPDLAPGGAGVGVPVHNLGGANIVPLGQGGGQPQQSAGSYRGFDAGPMPHAPAPLDLTPQLNQFGQAAQQHALLNVNPYQVQANQEWGAGSGLGAQLHALPTVDPNAAQFHPLGYNPQPLPTLNQPALPTRPAPGHDPISTGLGLLAGIVDPRGAGMYNAMPLEAATRVAGQQYEDRKLAFQQAQQQMELNYQAQLAQASSSNAAQLHNVTNQNAANVALGQQQYANAEQRAQILGGQTTATATAAGLEPLGVSQTGANQALAQMNAAQQEIEAAQKGRLMDLEGYRIGMMPFNRSEVAMINQTGRDAQTDAKDQTQQVIHGIRGASPVQPIGTGADTSTSSWLSPDMLKDPGVNAAQQDFLAKQNQWATLRDQVARQPAPTMNALYALHRAEVALDAATANRETVVNSWKAKYTPTPSTGGNTSPGGNATPPGRPVSR